MEVRFGGEPVSENTPVEPFIFTTIRYDPQLLHSKENTAVSCHQPCPFYMLEHHYTRLQVAKWSLSALAAEECKSVTWGGLFELDGAKTNGQPHKKNGGPALLLRGLLNAVETWQACHLHERPESLRIKLRLYISGKIRTEIFNPIPRISLATMFPRTLGVPADHLQSDWTIVLDSQSIEPTESTMMKTHDRSQYDRARAAAGISSYAEHKDVLLFNLEGDVLDASISTPYFYRNGKWVTPSASSGGQQGVTRRWALSQGLAGEAIVKADSLQPGEVVYLSNGVKGYYAAIFASRKI